MNCLQSPWYTGLTRWDGTAEVVDPVPLVEVLMAAKPVKKSFATPSAKPADVQYRMRRAFETAQELVMFLGAIDPAGMPEGVVDPLFQQAAALLAGLEAANDAVPLTRAQTKALAALAAQAEKAELELSKKSKKPTATEVTAE